jgi:integrase
MFNLAIDSKLRGCDLVSLRVRDVTHADQVLPRAMVVQRKTQRPVQFQLTEPTRSAIAAWIETANLKAENYLFPSRLAKSPHISTRQYARIVHQWVSCVFRPMTDTIPDRWRTRFRRHGGQYSGGKADIFGG